jgi:hypothetical protein
MERCPFPTLLWSLPHFSCPLEAFPSTNLLGEVVPLLPSPAGLFIYSVSGECTSPTLWSSGCFTLFGTCLFCLFQLLVYYSLWGFFLFFPWVGSVCLGSYADLFQGCLWGYHMLLSSPGGLLLLSRLGAGIWWCRSPPSFSI